MKSVGEVMAIGRTFKESLQKALRGLEIGRAGLGADGKDNQPTLEDIKQKLRIPNCDRVFYIRYAFQQGLSISEIAELSSVDPWFIQQLEEIFRFEQTLLKAPFPLSKENLLEAKRNGFSDKQIAYLKNEKELEIRKLRKSLNVLPTYKVVDTCAGEFPAMTPYFYSTYEEEDEGEVEEGQKVIILGGGPNRIGQGIEFDYCCVHAVMALHEAGFRTIMVNCNPETVSTDYDISDRLYFEPLTFEDVMHIVEKEKPLGLIVQFGGQTPLNLTLPLEKAGVKILGTSPDSIDISEDRMRFGKLLEGLEILHPAYGIAKTIQEAKNVAQNIGYPVIVRPSYVLGGRGMKVVYDEEMLNQYVLSQMDHYTKQLGDHPILIDRFLNSAKEVDVDALSDGEDVYIGGILEHIEEAGIHSGDSACILPPKNLSKNEIQAIVEITKKLARKLEVRGLLNIQFAIQDKKVYVLEVNPRASRTVPFISKATGIPIAKIAARLMIGQTLKELKGIYHFDLLNYDFLTLKHIAVKEAVLPWVKFPGTDALLSPEMKSTGEVMGLDFNFASAFLKSQVASGTPVPLQGTILCSLRDQDKRQALPIINEFIQAGFKVVATEGTYRYFKDSGLIVECVKKISEGRPHVVDLIKNRQVQMVVNTPSQSERAQTDGSQIRGAAIQFQVPIFTTLSALKALNESILEIIRQKYRPEVQSLQDYFQVKN